MGIAERKEREKTKLKELILLKSKEIFSEFGFEKFSIRKLARAIEYSPGTIYLYFKDKDEIMHELMEMGFTLMGREMSKLREIEDSVERLRQTGIKYVIFGLEHKDWYDLMFNSEKPMNHIDKCNKEWCMGEELFQILNNTVESALEQCGITDLNTSIVSVQIWSMVHGLVNLSQSSRLEKVEKENDFDLMLQTIDSSIKTIFKK